MNNKKKSKKRIIILIVVLVIVALLVIGFLRMRANIAEMAKTTYEIVSVEKGTVEVKVKGAGAVEPLLDETVYVSFSGAVQEVLVENGDVVTAGDVIVTFTSDALETEIDTIETEIENIDTAMSTLRSVEGSEYIKSPIAGTMKVVYAADGDSVDVVMDQYGALAAICPDGLMQTVIPYYKDVYLGQKVTITMDTKSVEGEIYSINEEHQEATVRFDDDDFTVGETIIVTTVEGAELGETAIEIANPIYITGQGGVVEKIYKDAGDDVYRGSNLFRLDGDILSADLYTQIEKRTDLEEDLDEVKADIEGLVVSANVDGVVSGLNLNKEQIVQEGTALFNVQSNHQIKLDVEIDELDIANIELETEATVAFDALPDNEYTAKVVKINPIGVSVNNVTNFTITLEIDNAQGVLLGMSADVEIISQVAENVLTIPLEAIQIIDGEKYIVLEQDINEDLMATSATHKIVTGITDGVNIEVLQGLSEGDRVAVPRANELSAQQQMMMGGYRDNSESDVEE